MHQESILTFEMMRWGYSSMPGIIFYYAKELDLDLEDIGLLTTIFYTLERTKPLYMINIKAGQLLQVCPVLSKQKLTRKLSKLLKSNIISTRSNNSFVDLEISLEPLHERLKMLIIRDHPELNHLNNQVNPQEKIDNLELLVEQYRSKIKRLESELEEEKKQTMPAPVEEFVDSHFRRVADFISRKTGNLLSIKMSQELKRWLEEMAFTPEFLLCMLEMCFERKITEPRSITKIAKDLKEYSINTVEGLELYFRKYIDNKKDGNLISNRFDPDIVEFGNFTGIDMNADARKNIYYKWRYDWGFSHAMIMKAGELMCQHTKNGGLEYVDSVLNNWMSKEIRQVSEVEKELREFKTAKKQNDTQKVSKVKRGKGAEKDYEFYIPPSRLEELKNKINK